MFLTNDDILKSLSVCMCVYVHVCVGECTNFERKEAINIINNIINK